MCEYDQDAFCGQLRESQFRSPRHAHGELFEEQPEEYRPQVLPPEVKARAAIEAGTSQEWQRYVSSEGGVVCVDRFGASAPSKVLFEKLGITADKVVEKALALV